MEVNNLPVLLVYKGVKLEQKVAPVVKTQKLSDDNNRRTNEQEKRNVKTAAAILRISKQGKS